VSTPVSIPLTENCEWSEIICEVFGAFKLPSPAMVDGFLLHDKEGKILRKKPCRDASLFWKAVTSTYNDDDDMYFEVLLKHTGIF
jgi:hypothetical protein